MPKGCAHLLVNAPVDAEVHIKCFPQHCAVVMAIWNLQENGKYVLTALTNWINRQTQYTSQSTFMKACTLKPAFLIHILLYNSSMSIEMAMVGLLGVFPMYILGKVDGGQCTVESAIDSGKVRDGVNVNHSNVEFDCIAVVDCIDVHGHIHWILA